MCWGIKKFESFYCNICFIVVVRNQTCNINEVRLYRSVVLLICLKTFILALLFCKNFCCLGCSWHPKTSLSPLSYYTHHHYPLPLKHLISLYPSNSAWALSSWVISPSSGTSSSCNIIVLMDHPFKILDSQILDLLVPIILTFTVATHFPMLAWILLPRTIGLLSSLLPIF